MNKMHAAGQNVPGAAATNLALHKIGDYVNSAAAGVSAKAAFARLQDHDGVRPPFEVAVILKHPEKGWTVRESLKRGSE